MKTFCTECMKETESTLYAEVRECKACGKMWECPGNPETTALKARIAELEAALKVYADYDNWEIKSAGYPDLWHGDSDGPDVAERVLEGGE